MLLKLADCADDHGGNAWPAVGTLARQCGNLSPRAIQKILVKLRAKGLLVIQEPAGVRHKTVTYRITVMASPMNPSSPANSSSPLNPRSPVNPRSHTGELQDRGTPELQFTTPLNPSSPDPSSIRPPDPSTTAKTQQRKHCASEIDEFKTRFVDLYRQHRLGATYQWTNRDWATVDQLLTIYSLDDLVEMSEILLTLSAEVDEWVGRSDRSIAVLKHRGTFLSNLLAGRGTAAVDGWESVKMHLRTKLTTWDFHRWFASTKQLQISTDGRLLFVSVEGAEHRQWIHNHYRQPVMAAVAEAGVTQRLVFWPPSNGAPPDGLPAAMMQLQPLDETE